MKLPLLQSVKHWIIKLNITCLFLCRRMEKLNCHPLLHCKLCSSLIFDSSLTCVMCTVQHNNRLYKVVITTSSAAKNQHHLSSLVSSMYIYIYIIYVSKVHFKIWSCSMFGIPFFHQSSYCINRTYKIKLNSMHVRNMPNLVHLFGWNMNL